MLHHIDIPVPDTILEQAQEAGGYKSYYDTKNNRYIDGWDQKHIEDGDALTYSNIIKEVLELKDVRPRFYVQHKGMTIPMHKDRGTECSFNFILEGTSPITFEDDIWHIPDNRREETYKKAILNTQVMHGVYDTIDHRILYKISIFDEPYDEVVKRYEKSRERLSNRIRQNLIAV